MHNNKSYSYNKFNDDYPERERASDYGNSTQYEDEHPERNPDVGQTGIPHEKE